MSKQNTTSALRMSISEAEEFLVDVMSYNAKQIKAGKPFEKLAKPLLLGQPGCGKTSIVFAAAKRIGYDVNPMNAAPMDPTDMMGLPDNRHVGDDFITVWSKQETFMMQPNTVHFLDEVTKAPHMMNSLASFIHEGRVGRHHLPAGSLVVGAGNRLEDKSGDTALPGFVADRFIIVNVYNTYKHFLDYGANSGLSPKILGYIAWRADRAFGYNADQVKNPTHRSWEMADSVVDMGMPMSRMLVTLAGTVGEPAAVDFLAYLKFSDDLDTPEQVIANPTGARVPSGDDAQGKMYSMVSSLIGHANKKTIGPIMTYFGRLPSKEFVVYALKDLMVRNKELNAAPEVKKWKLENQALFAPVI